MHFFICLEDINGKGNTGTGKLESLAEITSLKSGNQIQL